jgi:hypothetical protein
MLNRRKLIIAFGITLLLIAAIFEVNALSNQPWLPSEGISIHIVIDNRTNKQIGPFVISQYRDSEPLQVKQIEPWSVVDVYYITPNHGGENAITMKDSNGVVYSIIPYFEQGQRGRVDIRVECVGLDGLSGKKRELVTWYFSFEWRSWGASACK